MPPVSLKLDDLLAGRHLVEPPRDTLARAVRLAELLPAPSGIGAWLASLVFDSAAQPLPAGVRSGGSDERRLLYELTPEGRDELVRPLRPVRFDLTVRRAEGAKAAFDLIGQLAPPWAGATVSVGAGRAGRAGRSVELRETGELLLRGVPGSGDALRLVVRTKDGAEAIIDVPLPEGGAAQ